MNRGHLLAAFVGAAAMLGGIRILAAVAPETAAPLVDAMEAAACGEAVQGCVCYYGGFMQRLAACEAVLSASGISVAEMDLPACQGE